MTDGPVRDIEETITKKGLDESSASLFPEGTLVVALYGATSGKLGVLQKAAATNQAICGIFPSDQVERDYLFWYLRHIRGELLEKRKGGAQDNLSQTLIRETDLPLPPLSEQRRIVAKIEELFSNLDAGVDDLQTAGQQLERYRLSVLQAAVEGRLTADWRRTHDPEPADQLLERILKERREQWEEDYRAKYEAKGKEPPSGWKSRYTAPNDPETDDLPDLPDGWIWTNIENVCIVYGGVTKNARKGGDLVEMPYLRVANVYANELRLDEIKQIKVKRNRLYKYFLEEGDLLVVEGNGSKSQIGRVARWDGSIDPCVHQNHLFKVRPMLQQMGHYLLWWMLSPNGRSYITKVASSTSGLYTLSMTKIRSLPVPLPPLAEQKQIVEEVERLLSVADDAAATADREEIRAEQLRQSILKQAFSGRLVPHDEDASPPSIDDTASERSSSDTSDGTDTDVEDLLGSADPSKQVEMDL
jgi:type I restriction enzyme S subunit